MTRLLGLTAVIGATLAFVAVPALAQGSRAAERVATEAQGAVEDLDPTLKETQRIVEQGTNQTVIQEDEDMDQTAVQVEEETDQATLQTEQQNNNGKGKKSKEIGVTNILETGGFITGSGAALLGLGAGAVLVSLGILARKTSI